MSFQAFRLMIRPSYALKILHFQALYRQVRVARCYYGKTKFSYISNTLVIRISHVRIWPLLEV